MAGKRKSSKRVRAGLLFALAADCGANVAILTGLMIVPCVGAIGLGTDVAQWVLWRRQLQNAADAAAMAGAYAIVHGDNADTAAKESLAKNQEHDYVIDAIESPPSVGSYTGDASAARVVLHTSHVLPFSSLFIKSPPRVGVSATAVGHEGTPACVLALDPTAQDALTASGSASIKASCGMRSNSTANPAADFGNNPVDVPEIATVGTISAGTGLASTTKLYQHVGAMLDPYATLPMPDFSTLCTGSEPNVTIAGPNPVSVTPGCYSSISVQGKAKFAPGIYYIDGGDFTVAANSVAAGDGVTFLFSSSSSPFDGSQVGRVNFNGAAIIDLTASTTGTYAGILFYQDRRAILSSNSTMQVAGTSGLGYDGLVQGAIYAPSTLIRFNGSSSLDTPCVQFVGLRVTFTGSTTVSNNCDYGSGASSFAGRPYTQLVE